jgi:ribonuclease P protein component
MPAGQKAGRDSLSDEPSRPSAERPRQRFPAALRLDDPAAFERAFKAGRPEQGRFFAVHSVRNALPYGRLGMVVARRTARSSVGRNGLKRLIREVFRMKLQELSGWDWVVRVKAAPTSSSRQDARAELASLLRLRR